jgi:hypothetical protein
MAIDMNAMRRRVRPASGLLKAMSSERRLLILCHLMQGEKSVGELAELIGNSWRGFETPKWSRHGERHSRFSIRCQGRMRGRSFGRCTISSLDSPASILVVRTNWIGVLE